MVVFMILFSIILEVFLGVGDSWANATLTVVAFNVGAVTSIISGYIGMKIAVYANSRTAVSAQAGYNSAFMCAFQAGAVMGYAQFAQHTCITTKHNYTNPNLTTRHRSTTHQQQHNDNNETGFRWWVLA